MKIKDINREELQRLLDSDGDKYEPLGMFICREEIGNASVYTAVSANTLTVTLSCQVI